MATIDELLEHRKHADPSTLARGEVAAQTQERRLKLAGAAMQHFRRVLLIPGSDDIRESILDDLRSYFTDAYFSATSPEEEAQRTKVALWSINLLWYAYLQAEGFAYAVNVELAEAIGAAVAGARHLDFGSGVGLTSQMFHSLGYTAELADSEEGLLAFARYRLERRGIDAQYIHLGKQKLPSDSYDAITAIDSLMLVPEFQAFARELREAARMGGVLFANFDTRRGVDVGWDILYRDDFWLRRRLQEAGFEADRKLGYGLRRYRAVETDGVRHMARGVRDAVLMPTRQIYWATRSRVSAKAWSLGSRT